MMKKRRYLISAAILAACVCIALGVLAMMPPQPGVTKANFDRIEKGMTHAEVTAILGEPNVDVFTDGDIFLGPDKADVFRVDVFRVWSHADGSRISIPFAADKVTGKAFTPSTETFTDKVRRWLHLPK